MNIFFLTHRMEHTDRLFNKKKSKALEYAEHKEYENTHNKCFTNVNECVSQKENHKCKAVFRHS